MRSDCLSVDVGSALIGGKHMRVASIPGASDTLVSLLASQLEARLGPSREGFSVSLFRSAQFTGPPTNVPIHS
jgi:hypothetical protein